MNEVLLLVPNSGKDYRGKWIRKLDVLVYCDGDVKGCRVAKRRGVTEGVVSHL